MDISRMSSASLILGILMLLPAFNSIWGDGCTGVTTVEFPVINMCAQSSVKLGRVYLSVTTDTMGSNTWCSCTLRPRTNGSITSSFFYLKATDSRGSNCSQSLIHITPFYTQLENYLQTFTCTTPIDTTSSTGITTDDVTITLTRPDTSVAVSYCVLVQPDRWQEADMHLSCDSGVTSSPTTTRSSSTPSFPVSFSSTPSTATPSSSPLATTRMMSSFQPFTSPPISQTSTTLPHGHSSVVPSSATKESTEEQSSFTAGALAGIVLGAIALICLTVIVIIILIIRHRAKLLSTRQSGADNSAYTSLSDVTRVNLRADPNYAVIQSEGSSSKPGGSDASAATGVYEAVDDPSSAAHVDSQTGSGTYYNA